MAAIGVIGSGTWGTALAVLLVQNKNQAALWSAFAEEADKIRTERKHPNLPETVIPEELEITTDLQAAMEGKEILVLAVPSIFVRQTAAKMAPFCKKGQIVVNVSKGIEEKTLKTLSEVIEEELPMADVAVLSGPSHAEEVSRLLPTTCVAGAHKRETAEKIQTVFMSQAFRVYTSPDMIGIEVGAALKKRNRPGCRNGRRTGVWRQYKSSADYQGNCGNRPSWSSNGRKAPDLCRPFWHRGSDRDLRQYAQPQPQGRNPHWKRLFHGRSHEGSKNGGRGCVLCQSGSGLVQEVPGADANRRAGQPDFI